MSEPGRRNPSMEVGKNYTLLCIDEIWRCYKCEAISNNIALLISIDDGSETYVRIKDATFNVYEVDRCAEQEMADFIHSILVKYDISYDDQNKAWELLEEFTEDGYYINQEKTNGIR